MAGSYPQMRDRSGHSTQEHDILGCELGLHLIHPNYFSLSSPTQLGGSVHTSHKDEDKGQARWFYLADSIFGKRF